jgi:hypothetical protein
VARALGLLLYKRDNEDYVIFNTLPKNVSS